jgi:hypothetical protein
MIRRSVDRATLYTVSRIENDNIAKRLSNLRRAFTNVPVISVSRSTDRSYHGLSEARATLAAGHVTRAGLTWIETTVTDRGTDRP